MLRFFVIPIIAKVDACKVVDLKLLVCPSLYKAKPMAFNTSKDRESMQLYYPTNNIKTP